MTAHIVRSRDGGMSLTGGTAHVEADQRATVRAVLHRVETGSLTAGDAYRCLELLGLVEMAREMRAARKARAA